MSVSRPALISSCLFVSLRYRMAKIYFHINQCKCAILCDIARKQILHDFRETYRTENMFTLTFILKNKRPTTLPHILRQNTYTDGQATESLRSATKLFVTQ